MVPSISIFILGLSLLSHGIQSAPTYNFHFCANVKFAPDDGSSEANLIMLLANLSSNATLKKKGFFNFSVTSSDDEGWPLSFPFYALYLCRGDVAADTCAHCVSYAVGDIVFRCPRSKKVVIWYDECSLRYSDTNIFGSDQEDPQAYIYSSMNISNPNQLAEFLGTTMSGEMASQAANDTKKFATKEVKLSSVETLYSLVQCTPDLPVADCIRCIQTGVSNFPSAAKGARTLLPSCTVRYETYPFYNTAALSHPVPTPSRPQVLTPAGTSRKGN